MKRMIRFVVLIGMTVSLVQASLGETAKAVAAAIVEETPAVVAEVQPDNKPGSEDALYAEGTKAMDEQRWNDAVAAFDRVIAAKGKKLDAALYWKAYSLDKLGRKDDSRGACDVLRKEQPSSTWNKECTMLRVRTVDVQKMVELAKTRMLSSDDWAKFDGGDFEVFGAGFGDGQNDGERHVIRLRTSKTTTEDDIKILALNSLMRQDPAKAMPLLRALIHSDKPLPVRRQALFVLSRSKEPEAQALLTEVATNKASPDLQREAVEILATSHGKDAAPTLVEIYKSTTDNNVKHAALSGLFIAHDAPRLVELARAEKDLNLKRDIVSQLALMKDPAATDYMMELLK